MELLRNPVTYVIFVVLKIHPSTFVDEHHNAHRFSPEIKEAYLRPSNVPSDSGHHYPSCPEIAVSQ